MFVRQMRPGNFLAAGTGHAHNKYKYYIIYIYIYTYIYIFSEKRCSLIACTHSRVQSVECSACARSVDKGMGYEKLTVDIEHAVMKRCCQLAGLDEAAAHEGGDSRKSSTMLGLVIFGLRWSMSSTWKGPCHPFLSQAKNRGAPPSFRSFRLR